MNRRHFEGLNIFVEKQILRNVRFRRDSERVLTAFDRIANSPWRLFIWSVLPRVPLHGTYTSTFTYIAVYLFLFLSSRFPIERFSQIIIIIIIMRIVEGERVVASLETSWLWTAPCSVLTYAHTYNGNPRSIDVGELPGFAFSRVRNAKRKVERYRPPVEFRLPLYAKPFVFAARRNCN